MVGLIPPAGSGGRADSASHVSADAASEVNKLTQTGISTMATKTAGSFGHGDTPTISIGLVGNAHPSVIVPMLRGTYGSDAVAVSHRLLLTTGRPIEPHAELPERLTLPTGFQKWAWTKLQLGP